MTLAALILHQPHAAPLLSLFARASVGSDGLLCCYTKLWLDAVAQLHGVDAIDDDLWQRTDNCLWLNGDPTLNLRQAQDAAFRGIVELGTRGGTVGDVWGDGPNFLEWKEDPIPLRIDETVLWMREPCNLASCVSFYRQIFALCDLRYSEWALSPESRKALVQISVAHAVGGFLYHASQMDLGLAMGEKNAGILVYVALQDAFSVLSSSASSVLVDLSATPRQKSAVELAVDANLIFINEDPADWAVAVSTLDAPSMLLGLSVTLCTGLRLVFPIGATAMCQVAVSTLRRGLAGGEDLSFVSEVFDPALRQALENARTTEKPRSFRWALFSQILGVMKKMVR